MSNGRFKFRAWYNGKMYKNITVGGFDQTVPVVFDHGWVNLWGSNADGVVMQSTGLKDRNGKEIFEGDVVEVRTFIGEFVGKYAIVWGHFGFSMQDAAKPETHHYFSTDTVTVIGNIYEDSHLLTDK